MPKKKIQVPAEPATPETAPAARPTRKQILIDMMRTADGVTAPELAAAVGWQVHSVRGFIAGTLKKLPNLTVIAERKNGATRYRLLDKAEA